MKILRNLMSHPGSPHLSVAYCPPNSVGSVLHKDLNPNSPMKDALFGPHFTEEIEAQRGRVIPTVDKGRSGFRPRQPAFRSCAPDLHVCAS